MEKSKEVIHWKNLMTTKGFIGLALATVGLWYLSSILNIVPDATPVVGALDNLVISILLLWGGYKVAQAVGKMFHMK